MTQIKEVVEAKRIKTRFAMTPTIMAFIVMLSAWILSDILINGFATVDHNFQVLQTAAFLGIVAAGQAMVIMTGGIDLSVSSVVTLSSVLTSSFIAGSGMPAIPAMLAALIVSTLIGFVNAAGITYLKLPPIIMTIAMISLIEGGMLIFTQGTPPAGMSPALRDFANSTWFFGMANVVFVWLIVSLLAYWLLNRSKWGRHIYALGTNVKASYLSGVSTAKINFIVYGLSGFLAGLTGVLQLGYMGSTYLTMGVPFQLSSIAAVVLGGISIIGGKGNYLGAIAGVLLITILKDVLTVLNIPMAGRELFQGLLILIILLAYGRERKQR